MTFENAPVLIQTVIHVVTYAEERNGSANCQPTYRPVGLAVDHPAINPHIEVKIHNRIASASCLQRELAVLPEEEKERFLFYLISSIVFIILAQKTIIMSQAQDIIEAEEYNSENQEFEDDGYSVSSTQSSLVSINSSILRGQVAEGGRTYAVYGKEEYGFPMDEQELDRMDMAHAKYFALLERKRFLAPIAKDPQKVLDLGCGTGIWSIDFADQFPSAEVIGVDIAPTQPGWVPPNCRFELDDMEQPWTWKEDSFDFIFSRDLILSVRDFPKLIDQCYTHLKPNGYVEFQSVVGLLGCDDSTVPSTSALQSLSNNLVLGCTKFGTPIDDAVRWESWFKARGFVDVTVVVKKLPCTSWPKDARMKFLGACEMENLQSSLEGLTMRLFQKALGWDQKTVDDFLVGVRGDLRKKSMHAYWPYYVVYARKPGALENGGKGVGT